MSLTAEQPAVTIGLRLGESATDALVAEAERLGVSTEELANFSVLYYLADLDSGRIARTIPPPQPPNTEASFRSVDGELPPVSEMP